MNATVSSMPRPKKPPTDNIRLPVDLIKKVRQLAAHADVSLPDYLADILTPTIEKKFDEMVEALSKDKKKRAT